ncbi:MAG: hypothetical protein ACREUI_04675 [Burkholderiales bacterium]
MKWLAFITLMLPLLSSAAEPLGRLFYTPQQRSTLDNARRQNIKVDVVTETPAPENISVNGVIKRSDGQSTVWINNQPLNERRAPNGITIISRGADDASVTLQLPQSSRNVNLKVGQNLDATSGKIQENYQRPPLPPVIQKKTAPSAQSAQQNAFATPAPTSEKPKSRISSREEDDEVVSEPPPQTDEQPANPSTQQSDQIQY